MNILAQIVESKKLEIELLYAQYNLRSLSEEVASSHPLALPRPLFYQCLSEARAAGKPFFITEFKRKSPSEGWIHQDAELSAQVRAYAEAGAGAISILTDEPYFGGTYTDLQKACEFLKAYAETPSAAFPLPLLLQKDFILDPIQIYLAKLRGADLILLIAAILEPEQLDFLQKTAESIGLGVLVEVHDAEELAKIQHLDFPVLGINNRDLKTFRTALNRVNVLKQQASERFVIAESGVLDDCHFQMLRKADGFLIGTGLMRNAKAQMPFKLTDHFQSQGRWLFKACGIRTPEMLAECSEINAPNHSRDLPDFIGINFSLVSKRVADVKTREVLKNAAVSSAVAVFYQNTESEILEILENYSFKTIQLYAGDVTPAFVRSLKVRVLLAVKVSDRLSWNETFTTQIEPYAADVDCFILDGAKPGSGARILADFPTEFPYPFLLAGGLHEENLDTVLAYQNCIGVDIASGIETEGLVDFGKIRRIARGLAVLPLPHDLSDRI
jgi:indole-3-glycerol phosphate synthase